MSLMAHKNQLILSTIAYKREPCISSGQQSIVNDINMAEREMALNYAPRSEAENVIEEIFESSDAPHQARMKQGIKSLR